MLKLFALPPNRRRTHAILALITIVACIATIFYAYNATPTEIISIGTGYIAFLYIALTLLIGPATMLRKRRNPVNIDLRRDIGIWAGIASALHVIFSFQIFQNGDILAYFFTHDTQGYHLSLDLFGTGNETGLIAFLILLPILFTSNQISLKLLKGKLWKLVQRFTYVLFALSALHTFVYQVFNIREELFVGSLIAVCVAVVVAQGAGITLTLMRSRQRAAVANTPSRAAITTPVIVAPNPNTLHRRRFLLLAGTAVLGGTTVGAFATRALTTTTDAVPQVADILPTQPPIAATQAAPVTNIPTTTPNVPTQTPNATSTANSPTRNAATTTPAPTATKAPATTAANPTTGSSANRVILATVTTLAAGKALKFTTPDTGESAFVIHRLDGSIKAYNAECTHRPYALTYDTGTQELYCALHRVSFECDGGSPLSAPARTALKSYSVEKDTQGNIVYVAKA